MRTSNKDLLLEVAGLAQMSSCEPDELEVVKYVEKLESEHRRLRAQLANYNSDDFLYNDGSEHMGEAVDELLESIPAVI